ncbi:MAG TPA: crosslink repair DNA glycosylase YcaQ family protein [Candidatus Binatia bacterium]|nr:crosslink repair DNA glycosylase YcaQ family protein [Candidatus Binatia bacterium]
MTSLSISGDHARRFLVRRHLLAPPRSLAPEPESVLAVVERLGLLQFDPLEVPGARNHDLVLHARVAGYERAWCERWLYGPDRRLIELYNKSLNIVPVAELPHYRVSWSRNRDAVDNGILKEQAPVTEAVLRRLKTDGPLSTAAFGEHSHAVDWWWAPTRASRAVMEALFVTGRIGIARRDGNRRYYDLIERLVPPKLLKRSEPEEEAMTHRLLSRFRATGMTAPAGTSQIEVMYSAGSVAERRRRTARLVDDAVLLPIEVEGLKGTRYVLAAEEGLLDATADPASLPPPAASFLAPLDPLVWDRRLLRELWDFAYLWEVYVPEAKRQWGYYVLPILYCDRFVGRIEPRLNRKTKTLNIIGIWFEPTVSSMEDPRFIAALGEAVEAYRSFVGATRVTWPRTRPGRDVAGALRRLPAA